MMPASMLSQVTPFFSRLARVDVDGGVQTSLSYVLDLPRYFLAIFFGHCGHWASKQCMSQEQKMFSYLDCTDVEVDSNRVGQQT